MPSRARQVGRVVVEMALAMRGGAPTKCLVRRFTEERFREPWLAESAPCIQYSDVSASGGLCSIYRSRIGRRYGDRLWVFELACKAPPGAWPGTFPGIVTLSMSP